jgi:hypothetical protein
LLGQCPCVHAYRLCPSVVRVCLRVRAFPCRVRRDVCVGQRQQRPAGHWDHGPPAAAQAAYESGQRRAVPVFLRVLRRLSHVGDHRCALCFRGSGPACMPANVPLPLLPSDEPMCRCMCRGVRVGVCVGLYEIARVCSCVYPCVLVRAVLYAGNATGGDDGDGRCLLYTWGSGLNGQLGHGDRLDRLVPTVVLDCPMLIVSAAGGHSASAVVEGAC